ncbi:unnamed protein product [Rangifer tarandus platyrhynchus]|uniref:Uncharacterized protein n=1 Tax=Rangifer tarandus platyrhynchus TaxID=3082113 RepID=A0ABN8Y8B6_RANTA|nr:unnamed protein product [Rangifer tarandus platyrhynchus]
MRPRGRSHRSGGGQGPAPRAGGRLRAERRGSGRQPGDCTAGAGPRRVRATAPAARGSPIRALPPGPPKLLTDAPLPGRPTPRMWPEKVCAAAAETSGEPARAEPRSPPRPASGGRGRPELLPWGLEAAGTWGGGVGPLLGTGAPFIQEDGGGSHKPQPGRLPWFQESIRHVDLWGASGLSIPPPPTLGSTLDTASRPSSHRVDKPTSRAWGASKDRARPGLSALQPGA